MLFLSASIDNPFEGVLGGGVGTYYEALNWKGSCRSTIWGQLLEIISGAVVVIISLTACQYVHLSDERPVNESPERT